MCMKDDAGKLLNFIQPLPFPFRSDSFKEHFEQSPTDISVIISSETRLIYFLSEILYVLINYFIGELNIHVMFI